MRKNLKIFFKTVPARLPFATGDCEFKIYGYLSCTVNSTGKMVFKDLVYTGETSGLARVVADVEADVIFALTACNSDSLPKGTLAFDTVKITVPEGKHFYGLLTGTFYEDGVTPVPDTVVNARVFDGTTLIAQSVTTVTTDCPAGTSVTLNPFIPVDESSCKFTAGEHNIVVAVEYQDKYTKERFDAYSAGSSDEPTYHYEGDDAIFYEEGFAKVGDLHIYPITFENGKRYVLFQDLNDLTPASETPGKTKAILPYVAKMLKSGSTDEYNYYRTFTEAVEAYSEDTRPIVLISDVDNAGTVGKSVMVNPNSYTVKNLTVSDDLGDPDDPGDDVETVVTLKLSDTGEYVFKGDEAELKMFSSGGTSVVVDTSGGDLTVNTTDNVIHNGSVENLTITKSAKNKASNLGYHLQADVSTEVKITEGFLNICGCAEIEKLNVTATTSGQVELKGTPVNIVKKIYYNTTDLTDVTIGSSNSDTSGAYRVITLNAHGGTAPSGGSTAYKLYGIEGMYLSLPEYEVSSARKPYAGLPHKLFNEPSKSTGSLFQFAMWNTIADSTGTVYTDGERFVLGSDNVVLNAMWGSPIGGVVFFVNSAVTTPSHSVKFYNKNSNGTFTEVPNSSVVAGYNGESNKTWYVWCNTTYNIADKYFVISGSAFFDLSPLMGLCSSMPPAWYSEIHNVNDDSMSVGTAESTLKTSGLGKGHFSTTFMNGNSYFSNSGVLKFLRTKNSEGIVGCKDWYIPSIGEAVQLKLYNSAYFSSRSVPTSSYSTGRGANPGLLEDAFCRWTGSAWGSVHSCGGAFDRVVFIRSF